MLIDTATPANGPAPGASTDGAALFRAQPPDVLAAVAEHALIGIVSAPPGGQARPGAVEALRTVATSLTDALRGLGVPVPPVWLDELDEAIDEHLARTDPLALRRRINDLEAEVPRSGT